MITTTQLTKRFGSHTALEDIHSSIPGGSIFGLVGSNGAGKSTYLRLLAGIYAPDSGIVTVEGEPLYDNPGAKGRLTYVSDDCYFLPGASIRRMAQLYAAAYPGFNRLKLQALCQLFGLDPAKPLNTFSKGMRRQGALCLALCCQTDILLLDEVFDGLDPAVRNGARKLLYEAVCERGTTVVLTSHSLRELEDTCDQLALLHRGGLVLQSDVQQLKARLMKVQIVLSKPLEPRDIEAMGLELLRFTRYGSVAHLILRGTYDQVLTQLSLLEPLLCEAVPLSLEEVFIYELAARGYAFETLGSETEVAK